MSKEKIKPSFGMIISKDFDDYDQTFKTNWVILKKTNFADRSYVGLYEGTLSDLLDLFPNSMGISYLFIADYIRTTDMEKQKREAIQKLESEIVDIKNKIKVLKGQK